MQDIRVQPSAHAQQAPECNAISKVDHTFGMKAFAHSEALVPNWYGRISISVDPSSMNKALLLPEPWMVTSTFAERAAAMFLLAHHLLRQDVYSTATGANYILITTTALLHRKVETRETLWPTDCP